MTDIHILGRRGPAQASFTTKELRELGELADAAVIVHEEDLVLDPVTEATIAQSKVAARNFEVLQEWSQRGADERRRRIHMRFYARPAKLFGDSRLTGIVVERTRVDATGAAVGTGEFTTIPADLVIRSVGYRGLSLTGLAFDPDRGIVPNEDGRVLHAGALITGEYVAGWIKRGPSGIIGTNKKDAANTVASLLQDLDSLPQPANGRRDLAATLTERGVHVVTLDGWTAIDAAEIGLGLAHGRVRTTIHSRDALLALTRSQAPRAN